MASRFLWTAFSRRARIRVVIGLCLFAIGSAYGIRAGYRLGRYGDERGAFDRPLVTTALQLVRPPDEVASMQPQSARELRLMAVAFTQHDALVAETVLLMRLIVTATLVGLGLVLLTAGSTEWEVASEAAHAAADDQTTTAAA